MQVVPDLPTTVILPDGKEYNVDGDLWILPQGSNLPSTVSINWTLLTGVNFEGTSRPVLSARAVSFAKLYFLERVAAVRNPTKPKSANSYLYAILHFARCLAAHPQWLPVGRSFDWSDLTADMFDSWVTLEYRTKRKGSSAILVRRFYSWGAELDESCPDFSPNLASVLEDQFIKSHGSGELVQSRDKRHGAFTREELELIFEACEGGAGTDQDRAIAWTLLETVIRPTQMYLLTNGDLQSVQCSAEGGKSDGTLSEAIYRLRVRKLKQRRQVIKYHFLQLSEGCARLLYKLRLPESKSEDQLFWWLRPSYKTYIINRLQAFSRNADLRSPRLPIENPTPGGPHHELIHITPRRFRYGVTTDRINRGDSLEDVAESLGHKGTQTVFVYTEMSPALADDFQRATDYVIVPLVNLMEGRTRTWIPSMLADASPPVPPKQRLYRDAPVFKKMPAHQTGRVQRRSPRSDTWATQAEERIQELIARARNKFPLLYPGQDFDGQIWNVTDLAERTNTHQRKNFGFTTLDSTTGSRERLSNRPEDAMPAHFSDVVKSWMIISNHVTQGFNANRLTAARYFWNFLLTQQIGKAGSFKWRSLTEDDLLMFEQYLTDCKTRRGRPLSQGYIINLIMLIQSLIDFLASYGICRNINYIPQSRRAYKESARPLDERRLLAERKLPSPDVLECLGSFYHRLTTAPTGEVSDWMLIVISAIAILILTGLRVGELVTLPFDCEVEDLRPGGRRGEPKSYRYGIMYWVEKTGKKTLRVKWISPTAESVVRESVARIKRLTAAARERARILEADPTKIPLPPEIARRAMVTRSELSALLGYKSNRLVRTDPQGLLPQHGVGCESKFNVSDIEAYLLSRRVPYLYTIRHNDGTVQMLSESLFVIFAKQSRCRLLNPCRLLVEPVKSDKIQTYLSSSTNLFKTYGETEQQKELSANPHCFRHWLMHVAYKGGMPTNLLLLYFAKRYVSSLADYLHFSTDESDAYAPEALNTERFYVPV